MLKEDGVDQPLRGNISRKVAALRRAIGILDFLHADDVGRTEAVDDVVGEKVVLDLAVARIDILEIVGGER